MEWVVLWVVCAVLAWSLFVMEWRKSYDLTLGDALLFFALSLTGPAGLAAALLMMLIGVIMNIETPIVWRKK